MPLTKKQFITGTPEVPRLLQADAYTIGSGPHVSEAAKALSLYHVVPRRGFQMYHSFVGDNRIVFYGLRRILRDLLTTPITQAEIDTTEEFLKTFHAGGVPFHWDKDLWQRVVDERNGVLPIKIEAFEDGTVAFPYEPVMQITSAEGFGEVANYFESTLLKVWATSERVTVLRWFWQWLRDRCHQIHPDWDQGAIDFATSIMIHDFGDRAGVCVEESEVLGQAHLMTGMVGTDTVSGAYQDYADTKTPYGCSIHALAHRTVMGYLTEYEAHAALYNLGKGFTGITAHVSDTYDFFTMVEQWCKKLTTDWKDDENCIVIRPDSGDATECILHILRTADKYGLMKQDGKHKVSTRVRWIQGDSMNWESTKNVIEACIEAGYSPFGSGAFGIGGHLRNSLARDHTGLSMKLAAVGLEMRPVAKLSETPAKSSLPGRVAVLAKTRHTVVPYEAKYADDNQLVVWYDGTTTTKLEEAVKSPCLVTNTEVRERILTNFKKRLVPEPTLSPEIEALRDEVIAEQSAAIHGDWEEVVSADA